MHLSYLDQSLIIGKNHSTQPSQPLPLFPTILKLGRIRPTMICIEASLNTARLPIPSAVYTDKRTIVQDEYRRRNPNWNGEFYFYRAAHPWKEAWLLSGFAYSRRGLENENFVNRVAWKEGRKERHERQLCARMGGGRNTSTRGANTRVRCWSHSWRNQLQRIPWH